MQLKLENLDYQTQATLAVVNLFNGNIKNSSENANNDGIRFNLLSLNDTQIEANKLNTIALNGLKIEDAIVSDESDICIEMETGTGKTLVYVRTIYELYKTYGFTKFIILVPSIAIRKGVISSFNTFKTQLEDEYGFTPKSFEYESKNLMRVTEFVQSQHPTVMVMTLASFNSEDRILNQAQREDLLDNKPFIEAIASTRPIIIMDEPQEGMDTENSIKNIGNLNPLIKIRYSATHKVLKNLLYRLTPFESYQTGLVKKIEVMSIVERNDEATLKIEITEVKTGTGAPQVKLKAWIAKGDTFEFKATGWLKEHDNLADKTNNPSYASYVISRISKDRFDPNWKVTFSNGAIIEEHSKSGNVETIWQVQIGELIHMHFHKTKLLRAQGIKCLSLFFIDKVANYMGENPVIKNIFIEKYREIYTKLNEGKLPTDTEIQAVQGYYFAQKSNGEFADNEGGVKEQNKIYDLILKGRDELLQLDNPVQFIF
jgi:type III restriction enzyme